MTKGRPSEIAGERVRHYREAAGWSVRRLAEACAELGAAELTPAALTNIELGRRDASGRRRREISVDELLALGAALAVPALLLLVPLGSDDDYPLAPKLAVHPATAWQVITGRESLHDDSERDPRLDENEAKAVGLVRAFDALAVAHERFAIARNALRWHRARNDPGTAEHTVRAYAAALTDYARAVRDMLDLGAPLPPSAREWVSELLTGDPTLSGPDLADAHRLAAELVGAPR